MSNPLSSSFSFRILAVLFCCGILAFFWAFFNPVQFLATSFGESYYNRLVEVIPESQNYSSESVETLDDVVRRYASVEQALKKTEVENIWVSRVGIREKNTLSSEPHLPSHCEPVSRPEDIEGCEWERALDDQACPFWKCKNEGCPAMPACAPLGDECSWSLERDENNCVIGCGMPLCDEDVMPCPPAPACSAPPFGCEYGPSSFDEQGCSIDCGSLICDDIPVDETSQVFEFEKNKTQMISLFVQPEDMSIDSVFESVQNNISVIKDESGKIWMPAYGINQIENLKIGASYVVIPSDDFSLALPGDVIEGMVSLSFEHRWNGFGIPATEPFDTECLFAPYIENFSFDDGDYFFIKDVDDNLHRYNGSEWETEGAGISKLEPGVGYLLYTTQQDSYSLVFDVDTSSCRISDSPTPICPTIESCDAPGGCVYENIPYDGNGCIAGCGDLVCEKDPVECPPAPPCARPPEGCTYEMEYDENDCVISCGALSCQSSVSLSLENGATEYSDILIAGNQDVDVLNFRLSAQDGSVSVTDLYFRNDFESTLSDRLDFKLYDDSGNVIQEKQMVDGQLHFELSTSNAILVSPEDSTFLTVKVDVRDITRAQQTGHQLRLVLDNNHQTRGIEAFDNATGAELSTPDSWGTVESQTFVVYKSELSFDHADVQPVFQISQEIPVYRFAVTADQSSSVDLKTVTFDVQLIGGLQKNNGSLMDSDFEVVRLESDGQTEIPSGAGADITEMVLSSSSESAKVQVDFKSVETFSAGETRYYALKMSNIEDALSMDESDRVAVSFVSDFSYSAPASQFGQDCGGTGCSLVWSDISDATHSQMTSDWLNGFLIDMPGDADGMDRSDGGGGGVDLVEVTRVDDFQDGTDIIAGLDNVNVLSLNFPTIGEPYVVTGIGFIPFLSGQIQARDITMSLFVDGVQQGSARNLQSNEETFFNDLSFRIESQSNVQLDVVIDTLEISDPGTFSIVPTIYQAVYENKTPLSVFDSGDLTSATFDFVAADLLLREGGVTIYPDLLLAESKENNILSFDLEAVYDGIQVNDFYFENDVDGDEVPDNISVGDRYVFGLYDENGSLLQETQMQNGVLSFEFAPQDSIQISKGERRGFVVKAHARSITQSSHTGSRLRLSLDKNHWTGGVYARGISLGDTINMSEKGDIFSPEFIAYRSSFSLKHSSQQPDYELPAQSTPVYRFEVQSTLDSRELELSDLSFEMDLLGGLQKNAGQDLLASDFEVVRLESNGVTEQNPPSQNISWTLSEATSSTTDLSISFDTPEFLPKGMTQYYAVKLKNIEDVVPMDESDRVAFGIKRDVEYATPDTLASQQSKASVVWSDLSDVNHSVTTSDWLNGFLLWTDSDRAGMER